MQIMLRLPPGVEFAYLPGQYLNVIGPGAHRRSYSIANAPSADKRIELHVRRVPGGILSEYWFERARANDLLRLDGPIGTFFHRGDPKETVFLVTGTGYAPAKAILEDLAARRWPHPVLLIWGGRDRHDHYHVPAGGGLDLSFEAVLSREPSPHARRGYVQDVLLATGRDPADMIVYACGSEKMIAAARAALVAAGLPLKSFHSDAFVQSSPESDNV
jgi:CDP-4-dehydro-6-deoxyglucose reductase